MDKIQGWISNHLLQIMAKHQPGQPLAGACLLTTSKVHTSKRGNKKNEAANCPVLNVFTTE